MRSMRAGVAFLALMANAAAVRAQDDSGGPDYSAWASRLANLDGRAALTQASVDLAKLSDDEAFSILRNNWASISDPDHRVALASGLVHRPGRIGERALDAIDLMMTDPWPAVHQDAPELLGMLSFRRIEPGPEYAAWRRRTIGRPVGEVVAESARDLIARIEAAPTPQDATRELTEPWVIPSRELAGLLPAADIDRITRERVHAAIRPDATDAQAELATVLLDWWMTLPENSLAPRARRSLLEPALGPTVRVEVRMRAASAAAAYTLPWAIDPILALLRDAVAAPSTEPSRIGAALAAYGDPRVIPTVIAAIDAHNGYETVYGLGYFVLAGVTGVGYEPWHTGPWWRAWWELNRDKFPKAARIDVPVWPRSPAYTPSVFDQLEPLGVDVPPTFESLLPVLERAYAAGDSTTLMNITNEIGKAKYEQAIPVMISMIEADNTHATVYGLGHFGLGPITGVAYDESHTGPWWRAWWKANFTRYAAEGDEIIERPRTRGYAPSPWDNGPFIGIVPPTARDLLWLLARHAENGSEVGCFGVARALADLGDTGVVPDLVEIIAADNSYATTYGVGYFALETLAGVEYADAHDGPWWVRWWNEHRAEFPESVRGRVIGDPTRHEIQIDGDPMKRYVLIGPRPRTIPPAGGFKLVVVLPGGEGSPAFGPFVESMLGTLPEGYVIAQAISPRWDDAGEDRVIWPTRALSDDQADFFAEEFIGAIVEDVRVRRPIDASRIYAMGWSSGGTPVYTATLRAGSRISGAFVAMSVFRPEILPPLEGAKGKAFYLLHSPEDRIRIQFAEAARDQLAAAGGVTMLVEYEGGHTWPPDAHPRIRAAIDWLEANTGR